MTTPFPAGTGGKSGIVLEQVGRYESGQFAEDAAEIVATSADSDYLFVVNAEVPGVDVLDATDPADPERVDRISVAEAWPDVAEVTNVALKDEVPVGDRETTVLAVSAVAEAADANGRVLFYDAADRSNVGSAEVGATPDAVKFTPDGSRVLTADSGEPSDDYEIDPPGTVSVVDVREGADAASVEQADFAEYDGREDELRDRGVHVFGPNPTASTNLEPEYLTVADDGETAYVVLQLNNALAEVDVESATVEGIRALGYKNHDETGNELDASDVDRLCIRNWPVYGMYQPDAIVAFESDGETYLATANEGGMRDSEGYSEVTTVADLDLDPEAFDCGAIPGVESVGDLQKSEHLGNLLTTEARGDVDGDGRHEEIYAFGGRSFAIWRPDGTLVYDSGADFELLEAIHHPEYFNADGLENVPFAQSTVKGPEPEGIAVGDVGDRTYVFVGLERIASVVVYDVTDPADPAFVQYVNNRNFDVDPQAVENGPADPRDVGDLGPEGVTFVPASASPVDAPLVAVGNELSGTTTLYRVHALREAEGSGE
ncbi:choice-of-anchor I family protein (plasmid) [Halorussus limi]|uniref:Choice-of-anchor I family protein n=1 Tax=Halorussus limi TaxID=2938695 RepID=A0A8U0HZ66_9EURY|nr:choice-of-anchor I family protein [Halorussus limi]UPV76425.1 choice-of-anchor I family protein [Halorussus limi]